MRRISELVAPALPGVRVALGYLELSDPPAVEVLDYLVQRGCRRIVVLPLVLLGAGHSKSDVPAVALEARQRHAGIDVRLGSPLGVARALVEILGEAVLEEAGPGMPLLMVGRGTSDPDANADTAKAARLVAEWARSPFCHTGFSGVTAPSLSDAAGVFARLGYRDIAVAWWYLCHGTLIDAGRQTLAEFSTRTGVALHDAGHLGADPRIVALVTERYRRALGDTSGDAGDGQPNCDMCAYRAAWPGIESRVGQAVGVGHSHLAVEHRRHQVG